MCESKQIKQIMWYSNRSNVFPPLSIYWFSGSLVSHVKQHSNLRWWRKVSFWKGFLQPSALLHTLLRLPSFDTLLLSVSSKHTQREEGRKEQRLDSIDPTALKQRSSSCHSAVQREAHAGLWKKTERLHHSYNHHSGSIQEGYLGNKKHCCIQWRILLLMLLRRKISQL